MSKSLSLSLLLHLVACCVAVAMDPQNFTCEKRSPLNDSIWSTGNPPVPLTHIFCGQIKNGHRPSGFHARPGGQDPVSAKAIGLKYTLPNGVKCYSKEQVYNARNDSWIDRKIPPSGHFCFFPEAWNTSDIVRNLQNIYAHCRDRLNAVRTHSAQICGRNYRNQQFDVIIFLIPNGKWTAQRIQIATAYSTLPNEITCKNSCSLINLPTFLQK